MIDIAKQLFFIVILTNLSVAAVEDVSVQSKVAETLSDGKTVVSDLMEIIMEDYQYDPRGKKDPFLPYQALTPLESGEEVLEPSLPLQRFSLDQLSLVGVIWGGKKPLGMLVDENNKVYYVREQDPIGRNGGKVAKIREGEIVVLEVYIDGVGNKAFRPRVLKLQKRKLQQ